MKATVDITDSLLKEAKQIAARDETTLRELFEHGLRREIAERKKPKKKFKLRDGSVKGDGLQPEFQGASWEKIREAIYEGHGG